MTYDQAFAIAASNAPELIVMPQVAALPNLFAVKKTENGDPFSITLPNSPPSDRTQAEITKMETDVFILALNSAKAKLP